jgi:hypothetical protein
MTEPDDSLGENEIKFKNLALKEFKLNIKEG